MLEYVVRARRRSAEGSVAVVREAQVELDTSLAGRADALNPAELLLAALGACMIKGVERATPMIKFALRGVEVRLHAVRQDAPPKILSIDYELIVETDESDRRLELQFSAPVIEWRGPAPYFYARLPPGPAAEIGAIRKLASYGWGVIPVQATIKGVSFETSLFPKDGTYLLPLRDRVRRPLGITAGDEVLVEMTVVGRGPQMR